MDIKTYGVIGAGQMGNGIAQVAAMSGLNVIMNDIKEEFVQNGLNTITKNLARSVEKGKMTPQKKMRSWPGFPQARRFKTWRPPTLWWRLQPKMRP